MTFSYRLFIAFLMILATFCPELSKAQGSKKYTAKIRFEYPAPGFPTPEMNFSFGVNGTWFTADSLEHVVTIEGYGWDLIQVAVTNGEKRDTLSSFGRFWNTRTYVVSPNPCAIYDLKPAENARMGLGRMQVNHAAGKLLHVKMLDTELEAVSADSLPDYLCPPKSAMCPFSAKEFIIYKGGSQLPSKARFHFLHGERLTVNYNYEVGQWMLKLDGYLQDKEKVCEE